MDPVSKADRFVRLLRLRLEERAKVQGGARASRVSTVRLSGSEAVRAITREFARAGVDDAYLRRSLLEQLLADQFGANLVNDVKFQQLVDEVTKIMGSDTTIGPLLAAALDSIRSEGIEPS